MIEEAPSEQFDQDDLISLSSIADLVFCERRAALHFIEGVWEENLFTAEGHLLHDKAHDAGVEQRKDVRIVRGLRIRSLKLGLSGKADVVEFRRIGISSANRPDDDMPNGIVLPGAEGLWEPFPVEYKRGKLKHEKSYEIQVCAQAICLEEMLGGRIKEGAIFYGKSMRRHSVYFTDQLRTETEAAAKRMHQLIAAAKTPNPVYSPKCESCSLFGLCLPKTVGKQQAVKRYLAKVLKDE